MIESIQNCAIALIVLSVGEVLFLSLLPQGNMKKYVNLALGIAMIAIMSQTLLANFHFSQAEAFSEQIHMDTQTAAAMVDPASYQHLWEQTITMLK